MLQLSTADDLMADPETVVRHFPFRIGRSSNSDLSVIAAGVWDDHATIVLEEGRPVVLGTGDASVIVNGEQSKRHVIKSGDLLELGAARWRIAVEPAKQKAATFSQTAFWLALAALFAAQVLAIYRLTDQ